MERLTEKARNCDGTAVAKESLVIEYGLRKGTPSNYCCAVLTKLAEYEDLGLEPEQIREIDKLYAEQAKELGEYKKAEEKLNGISLRELADAYIRIIEKETDEKYSRGRLLSNEDADKWDEYKAAEKKGLLLKLPCKVGDYIWDNDFGKPCIYEITGFSFGNLNEDYCEDEAKALDQVIVYFANSNGSITGNFAVSQIGKTVFLTQAEAEAALKRMEGNHE